jgi:molybdate transport system ATP-binding protein
MKKTHAEAQPLLELKDVTLRLGDRTAFNHTNWTIRDGQQWAVIGANGSGKSLLMQAICGRVQLAGGSISYHFPDIASKDNKTDHPRRFQDHISYVSFDEQRAALARQGSFHQLRWNAGLDSSSPSVAQHLSADAIYRRSPFLQAEITYDTESFQRQHDRVIELLHVEDLLDRKLMQLSNGEMRKILIARALLREPQLLILDNPFTGLDSSFRELFRDLIELLIDNGLRLIVVTGRTSDITAGITHALAVAELQVAAQGPLDDVLGDPGTTYLHIPLDSSPKQILENARPTGPERSSGDVLVRMVDVTVSYGQTRILNHLNWTVHKNEKWALLGPNGAGKTTLLSLIMGDHPQAYANDITLFGRKRGSGESIWEIKEHIGWVSAELHLYYPREATIIDTVCSGFFDSMGLYRKCSATQRDAALAWLARLGIKQDVATRFGRLSHGEQRLVLIARALIKEPELLIMDEPCQGLDESNRRYLVQMIDEILKHLDAGLIYVTHEPDELPTCITHILKLDSQQSLGPLATYSLM